jgi:hypothetical protein
MSNSAGIRESQPKAIYLGQKGKSTCDVDIPIRKNSFAKMDAILPVTPATPRVPTASTHDDPIMLNRSIATNLKEPSTELGLKIENLLVGRHESTDFRCASAAIGTIRPPLKAAKINQYD